MVATGDRVRVVVPSGPNAGQVTATGVVVRRRWCGIDGWVVEVREDGTGEVVEHGDGWVRR